MSHTGRYTILIMNPAMTVVGNPIDCWSMLDVTLRFNEPGSGLFVAPGHKWIRDQLAPGNRVVVIRNLPMNGSPAGSILLAGPIEKYLHERSDDGGNGGVGQITVNFADDLAMVVARLVYPNPALAAAAQTAVEWSFTGNAEAALRSLVNGNAGPGALAARRVPNLALGSLAGVGTSSTWTAAHFEPIGDVMRRIADTGGGLGFRTRQVGTTIQFQVYAPPDASSSVRFSFEMGNVKYMAYEVIAPTTNAVIVGGQGEEAADTAVIERTDAASIAAWGRMESLVSRPGSTDTAELQSDGDAALLEGAETARAPANVADIHTQMYGVHYDLGTRVALSPTVGTQILDIVKTVHIQAWPTAGDVISPTVGSQAENADPAWVKYMRAIDRRVGNLERSVR